MRYRDYFRGIPVELKSPMSADRAVSAINDEARSSFAPFATGVVGRVWGRRLRLRYRNSIFAYNQAPVLAGRVEDAPKGSVLRLRYRAPAAAYIFYPMWYGFLSLFVIIMLASLFLGGQGNSTLADLFILGALIIFAALPIGMHYVFTRNSDQDLAELVDFLRRTIRAEPITTPAPLAPRSGSR